MHRYAALAQQIFDPVAFKTDPIIFVRVGKIFLVKDRLIVGDIEQIVLFQFIERIVKLVESRSELDELQRIVVHFMHAGIRRPVGEIFVSVCNEIYAVFDFKVQALVFDALHVSASHAFIIIPGLQIVNRFIDNVIKVQIYIYKNPL